MADLYTVKINDPGAGSDFTFSVNPKILQRDVERIFRMDVSPVVLGAIEREWVMACSIDAATPTATVTALDDFLSRFLHSRVVPTFFQIIDENAAVVTSSIGELTNVANEFEDVRITGYELDELGGVKPETLVAGAGFTLTVQARLVTADTNGIWFREQEWNEEAIDDAGKLKRTLTTHIKISEAKFASGTRIENLITTAGLKLTKPIAWRWAAPTKHSNGIAIRYPRYPLQTEAFVISAITNAAGGGAVSAFDSTTETVTEDLLRGIARVTLDVTAVGPNALVNANANKPAGAVGSTRINNAKAEAKGSWDTWLTASPITRAVTGVDVRFELEGGEVSRSVELRPGGFRPLVRFGPFQPWILTEIIRVFGKGANVLEDLPLPPLMDASKWVLLNSPAYGLPYPDVRGGDRANTLWVSTVRRRYVWDVGGRPFGDAGFRADVMRRYLFGNKGRGLVNYA